MIFKASIHQGSSKHKFSMIAAGLVFLLSLILSQKSVYAMTIQKIKSPGGIEAWLVEEHRVPLISMEFAFVGGASQDISGKEGLTYLMSGMMDEGAGKFDATAFQERKEELAFRMGFEALRDAFTGSFQSLTENKEESFELLRLALNEARFDQDAINRVRNQIITGLKFDANDPNKVASKHFRELAFGKHVYARQTKGSEASLNTITQADLKGFAKKNFAKDNLKIAVVGSIDAKTLGILLDKVFGSLPEKAQLTSISKVETIKGPQRKIIEMNVPQSVVRFGHEGLLRNDPDFIPAYVLNHIIGGGGFASLLTEEVREKRGLAYSVYSYLSPLKHGALYVGGVATKNEAVNKSIEVIKEVFSEMAKNGPTAEQLKNSKQYLTGSYALRFDTSPKIASQLLWIQIEKLGSDYIEKRNSMVEAVTLEDMKRVAKRLLKPENMIITIVGKPEQKS